jgi:splicing factor 3B subunit 2
MGKPRLSKNQKRRQKLKENKLARKNVAETPSAPTPARADTATTTPTFVPDTDLLSDMAKEYEHIFQNKMFRFDATFHGGEDVATPAAPSSPVPTNTDHRVQVAAPPSNSEEVGKKRKHKMTLAELRYAVKYPDVIEPEDVASPAPFLLASLKAHPNYVPVPRHWKDRRAYLAGKRGTEESTYILPDNIAATGIQQVRQAVMDAEEKQSLKQGQRERIRPKMGQMDIDYKVLHDAFFRYKTKPPVSGYGDLYFEGKEFVKARSYKGVPGVLSRKLREALHMAETTSAPPPWLLNMQRHGLPPSYPHLKVPGVNAPLPEGAQYGFQNGGWGQPPVDRLGKPLYGGDVFGVASGAAPGEEDAAQAMQGYFDDVDKSKRWGEMITLATVMEDQEDEERDMAGMADGKIEA